MRVTATGVFLTLVLSAAVRIDAHPASDTSVVIAVRDRHTIEIAIASDATSLVAKLEALSGTPVSSPVPATRQALTARLTSLGATLADHAVIMINGVRLSTRPGAVIVDDRGLATMHLEGIVRPGVSTLIWSTDLMYGTYPLVVQHGEGAETIRWLDGRASSDPIAIDQLTAPKVSVWSAIWLGFTHIVPKGLDHILFVLGLFLLSPRMKQLVWQVSAFTIAHTVTLGLSLYGVVSAPGHIVEPLIALSVAYVGVENLFTSRLRPWRVVVVFAFGLLHGLGFAGAMSELPYSHADLIGMLVSFNVGVELGQLAVIAAAALVLRVVAAYREAWQRPVVRVASAGIGVMGLLWTVDRLVA
jgi:hydrogenase/urease accessory protein HupE